MKLQFFGAAGTVTGSKTLLSEGAGNNVERYLVDAGLYQGEDWLTEKNNINFNFEFVKEIKAIFITHAHLDHCGYLPYLINQGFSGPIFMTKATSELVELVLKDAFSIMEKDLKDKKIEKAHYSIDDLSKVFSMINIKSRDQVHKYNSLNFKFIEAGHILGASSLNIKWNDKYLLFSGDIGRQEDPIHMAPNHLNEKVDALIIEGTYGRREHSDEPIEPKLKGAIDHIRKYEGVLLIPSFAIARSAVILKALTDFFAKNPSLKLKVYVDSPMMIKALRIYEENAVDLKVSREEFENLLDNVKLVEYPKDRKKLQKVSPPYILLSSSGMLSGGRSIEHFERLAIKESNFVMLAGYQGVGTLGRQVLDGQQTIISAGRERQIKARVDLISQLSAHADESELLEYISHLKNPDLKVFVNHAEPETANLFSDKIEKDLKLSATVVAEDRDYEL